MECKLMGPLPLDPEPVEKVKIYVTEKQADWCKRQLGYDPRETEGYVVTE